MKAVLDASVVVRAIIPGQPYHREVHAWLATVTDAIAPALLPFEVTSALRHLEFMHVIPAEIADGALAAVLRLRVTLRTFPDLHLQALQLARALAVSRAQDTAYLAVALAEGCPLFTLDERFLRNCTTHGYPVRHPVVATT